MTTPAIELIHTDDGPMWQVDGLGMTTRHVQLWQAMVLYECLCVAKGIQLNNWNIKQ